MRTERQQESNIKWTIQYVLVPLIVAFIGAGAGTAIIVSVRNDQSVVIPVATLTTITSVNLPTLMPSTLSRCEITQRDFPQSIEAIAVKFDLPVAVIFDIIRENCGPNIVDGFVLRSGTVVTLQVPEGGCIDAPPDAVYTDERTVSNGVGGQRAFGGTVSASAITYRVWCSR